MRFLYANYSALLVALVASALTWLFGGTRNDLLIVSVPWMLLFLAEALFVFPQRHEGESAYEARERVWRALRRDPVTWLSLALLVVLAVPFVNTGLCPLCDAQQMAAGADPRPPVPWLPFCVNRLQHLNVFLWFATALLCALTVRTTLCSRGKRIVVAGVVWNGFFLALLGFVQISSGARGPYWTALTEKGNLGEFFATWGYPNMAGDYFTTLFALAMALWRRALDDEDRGAGDSRRVTTSHRVFWRRHLYLLPAVVFYVAAAATLSRAAIILVTVLAVAFFAHAFVSLTRKMHRAARVRRGTVALVSALLVAFFAILSAPESVQREVDTLGADVVLDRLSGKGQYHTRVATEIWKEHPAFGCGGWGYKHFCLGMMTPAEKKSIQMVGGINVHNDWLQMLAEHGLVGLLLLLALIVGFLKPTVAGWKRLYAAAKFARGKERPARPIAIFALPAPVFAILLALLATTVHSFGDCPLRSAAVIVLFFTLLPATAGFLPPNAVRWKADEDED